MTRTTSDYYSIDDARLARIAALAGITTHQAGDYCLADWPEAQHHQDWLDSATVEDIAKWASAPLEQCLYCGRWNVPDVPVPGVGDEDAWLLLADDHTSACEWVATRDHRLP